RPGDRKGEHEQHAAHQPDLEQREIHDLLRKELGSSPHYREPSTAPEPPPRRAVTGIRTSHEARLPRCSTTSPARNRFPSLKVTVTSISAPSAAEAGAAKTRAWMPGSEVVILSTTVACPSSGRTRTT